MDNITVMLDGRISEFGTYKELLEKKGAFADFLKQHLTVEDITEVEGLEEVAKDLENVIGDLTEIRQRKNLTVSDSESEFESFKRKQRQSSKSERKLSVASIASSSAAYAAAEVTGDQLIEVENVEKESVKASVYLDYFRAAGWEISFATVAFYVVFQGFSIGANLWLSEWTSLPIINGTQDSNERNFYLGIYGALGFMQGIYTLKIGQLEIIFFKLKYYNYSI